MEEWIEGVEKDTLFSRKNLPRTLKILAAILAVILVCALAVGLFIELS